VSNSLSVDRAGNAKENADFRDKAKALMKTALSFITSNKQISLAVGATSGVIVGNNFFNEVAAGLGTGDYTQAKITTLAAACAFVATYAVTAAGSALKKVANRESADEARAKLLGNKAFLSQEEARFLWGKMLDDAKSFEGGLFNSEWSNEANNKKLGNLVDKGMKSIRALADHNEPKALLILSRLYYTNNALVVKDEALGKELLEKAVNTLHPDAIHRLSGFYFRGEGGYSEDSEKGLRLLELAAEKGGGAALCELGDLYAKGDQGLSGPDVGKAERCYERAQELGYELAGLHLEQLKEINNFDGGVFKSRSIGALEAIAANDPQASYELAQAHYFGIEAEQNTTLALQHLQVAANAGHLEALSMQGQIDFQAQHLNPFEVEASQIKGLELLGEAARRRNKEALGMLYKVAVDKNFTHSPAVKSKAKEIFSSVYTKNDFDLASLESSIDIQTAQKNKEKLIDEIAPAKNSSGNAAFKSFYESKAFNSQPASLINADEERINNVLGERLKGIGMGM